jgi:hypothetical protein
MASEPTNLTESGITIPSDSENYDANNELSSSSSPASSSSTPLILYKPPTIWGLLRGAAINLFLPFVNGLMLGFGELVANEAAYRLGWSGTKVCWRKDRLRLVWRRDADAFLIADIPYASIWCRLATRGPGGRDACGSRRAEEEEWSGVGYVHGHGVGDIKTYLYIQVQSMAWRS